MKERVIGDWQRLTRVLALPDDFISADTFDGAGHMKGMMIERSIELVTPIPGVRGSMSRFFGNPFPSAFVAAARDATVRAKSGGPRRLEIPPIIYSFYAETLVCPVRLAKQPLHVCCFDPWLERALIVQGVKVLGGLRWKNVDFLWHFPISGPMYATSLSRFLEVLRLHPS